jgi:hypothetical protein
VPVGLAGRPFGNDDDLSYVDADNVGGARMAVQYLLKPGRGTWPQWPARPTCPRRGPAARLPDDHGRGRTERFRADRVRRLRPCLRRACRIPPARSEDWTRSSSPRA